MKDKCGADNSGPTCMGGGEKVLSWKMHLLTFETHIVAKRCSAFAMGAVAISRIQPPKIMFLYGPRSVFLTALSVCMCKAVLGFVLYLLPQE